MKKIIYSEKIIYFDAIDRRTTSGKWIANRVKEISIKDMLLTSIETDICTALTLLRYKDYMTFMTKFNLN